MNCLLFFLLSLFFFHFSLSLFTFLWHCVKLSYLTFSPSFSSLSTIPSQTSTHTQLPNCLFLSLSHVCRWGQSLGSLSSSNTVGFTVMVTPALPATLDAALLRLSGHHFTGDNRMTVNNLVTRSGTHYTVRHAPWDWWSWRSHAGLSAAHPNRLGCRGRPGFGVTERWIKQILI